jgi:hypothetical protein
MRANKGLTNIFFTKYLRMKGRKEIVGASYEIQIFG